MIGIELGPIERGYRILCLGAHADDIEIGCGGMILSLLDRHPGSRVDWVVFSGDARRAGEATRSAERFLTGAKEKNVHLKQFRESFFPYVGGEIKNCFETLKQAVSPDLILTHYRGDAHQDHRLISELTWNTFRDHWILEYEIPKYDGDLGSPNLFVPLAEDVSREKVRIIVEIFGSQRDRSWFDEGTFFALMRLRGVECAAPSRYAEAFYSRKACLRLG